MRDNLGQQVSSPTLALAARVKELLEDQGKIPEVQTNHGLFYISKIELMWSDGGEAEVIGYLCPDEAEGTTLDFWTPSRNLEED